MSRPVPAAVWRLLQQVPEANNGLRWNGEWRVKCPAHSDHDPSLALGEGADGKLIMTCRSRKCSNADIIKAWDVPWSVLFPNEPEPNGHTPTQTTGRRSPKGEPEAVYDYVDEKGSLLFQVCRFPGKEFRQRRPQVGGGWAWNLSHVRRVLYHLDELTVRSGETVWVCEGEKDTDRLRSLGLLATTAAGGAKKWTQEHTKALKGRRVIVLPDNDDPGREHATVVANALHGHAAEVVVLELEGLEEHGDVSDWLDAGHPVEELIERAQQLKGQVAAELGVLFASVEIEPVRWLWPSYLAVGKVTIIVGPPGDGKTMVGIDLGARVTQGAGWPNGALNHEPAAGVVYCSAEDELADTLLPRFVEAGGDPAKALALNTVGKGDQEREVYFPDDLDALDGAIRRVGARLVVIDPWGGFLSGKLDGNYEQAVRQAMRPLKTLAERAEVAVLVIMHPNKNTATSAMYRAAGSLGTVAAARLVYACGRDPEHQETRVIAPIKVNLVIPPASLAFTVTQGELAARVEWNNDPVELSAEQVLAPAPSETRKNSATRQAKAMLQIILADQAIDRETVIQQVMDAADCSERTVKRAANELGVVSKRTGFGMSALWMLAGFRPPEQQEQSGQDDQSGKLGHIPGEGPMAQLEADFGPTAEPNVGPDAERPTVRPTVLPGIDGPTCPTGEPGPTAEHPSDGPTVVEPPPGPAANPDAGHSSDVQSEPPINPGTAGPTGPTDEIGPTDLQAEAVTGNRPCTLCGSLDSEERGISPVSFQPMLSCRTCGHLYPAKESA